VSQGLKDGLYLR